MSVIHVLFPHARAELVRLLFADPARELHLRELARLSNPPHRRVDSIPLRL